MKQSLVMHVISGLHTGGAEMMLLRLLKGSKTTDKKNIMVVSLTEGGTIAEELRESGVKVIQLPRSSFIKSFTALSSLVSEYKPTLIQSWLYRADLLAGLVGRLRCVSVIWNVRQTETSKVSGQAHIWLVQRINSLFSYMLPKEIIYCAQAAKKSHQSIGYSKSKGIVISNGVDTDKYRPNKAQGSEQRSNLGVGDDEIIVGMVARLDPLKNHQRFFRVMAEVIRKTTQHKIKLLLVGKGMTADNDKLIKLLGQHQIQGNCLLAGEQKDIPSFLNAMDIHLLTSDNEGWPNVLGEAMSAGCLCVATDVGDVSQILDVDLTSVIEKHDEQAMVESVIRFIEMTKMEQDSWSEKARESIQRQYSLDEAIAQYNRLYSDY